MKKNNAVLYDILNKKATEIDNGFLELIKLGASSDTIKKYLDSVGATEDYSKDYLINALILWYNTDPKYWDNYEYVEKLLLKYDDVRIKTKDDIISVKTKDYAITSYRLSDHFPVLDTLLGYDLYSLDKCHLCHNSAIIISQCICDDNELVSGYYFGCTDKSKYFHTFVETVINGKEYVIDTTINALIRKTAYYRMHHIKESDIISRIDKKDVENDTFKYEKGFETLGISSRDYELFRDEIIKEFEKKERDGFKL